MHNKVFPYFFDSQINGEGLMNECRSCTYGQTNRYPDRIATPAAAPVQHGHTSEAPIYQRVLGTSPP